jgi:hypothetical protein
MKIDFEKSVLCQYNKSNFWVCRRQTRFEVFTRLSRQKSHVSYLTFPPKKPRECIMSRRSGSVASRKFQSPLPRQVGKRSDFLYFSSKNYHPIPWRDSISRPIISISSVAVGEYTTRPRHHNFPIFFLQQKINRGI